MKEINNGELRVKNIGDKVTLKGWVSNRRKLGSLIFIDLRDRWGTTQVVIEGTEPEGISKESVIEVFGSVLARKDKNSDMATGEIEVHAERIIVLAQSEVPPFAIRDELDAKEETRLKHRFIDLRRPKMVKNLKIRHAFIKSVRDFLDEKDFLEIETPLLSKSTPEGARDYLVPTRTKGKFFALPQSPQIYKQLLMASGMERYFQIARCFRDEDLRADRQPEFTQLDMEMSFANPKQIKSLVEDMMKHAFANLGHELKIPFKEMEYDEAIDKYGSDKPDVRFGLELIEVTKEFSNTAFNAFKSAKTIKMISFDRVLNKKEIKKLEEIAKKNKAKGLFWAAFDPETNEETGPGYKFIEEELHNITKKYNISGGTLLFVGDEYDNVVQSLGAVRIELNKMFKLASEGFDFTWIVNWPLFEYNKENERYIAAHHPFTQPSPDTVDSFDKDPKNARAIAYDLVLNGYEIGGGSLRINDPKIQKRMFEAIGMSTEIANSQFGFFLEAFKYGLPPHGGIAFGIDRIITILAREDSIREVIAFPKNTKGMDPMSQSPSVITTDQLDEYFLKLKNNPE